MQSQTSEKFEPEIVVLYCGRSLANHDCLPEGTKRGAGFKVRFVMMPCSSKIETYYLVKLIEQGADGVFLVACPEKHCQFLVGSVRAEKRMKYTQTLLDEVGMGADRLGMIRSLNLKSEELVALAREHASTVRPLGINPLDSIK